MTASVVFICISSEATSPCFSSFQVLSVSSIAVLSAVTTLVISHVMFPVVLCGGHSATPTLANIG